MNGAGETQTDEKLRDRTGRRRKGLSKPNMDAEVYDYLHKALVFADLIPGFRPNLAVNIAQT